MARTEIEGLTNVGYTAQTFQLAKALRESKETRERLIQWLSRVGDEVTYSNEAFDRDQNLAAFLADTIRKAA